MRCARRGLMDAGFVPVLAVLAGAGFFVAVGVGLLPGAAGAPGLPVSDAVAPVAAAAGELADDAFRGSPPAALGSSGPSLTGHGLPERSRVRSAPRMWPPASARARGAWAPALAALLPRPPHTPASDGLLASDRSARAGRLGAPSTAPPLLHD